MIAFAVPALHLFQCSCPTLRIPLLRGKREVSQDLSEFQEHVMGQNLLCIKCMYIYIHMYVYVCIYVYIYTLQIRDSYYNQVCIYIERERKKNKTYKGVNIYFPAVLVFTRVPGFWCLPISLQLQKITLNSIEPSSLCWSDCLQDCPTVPETTGELHWALPAIQSGTLTHASVKNSAVHCVLFTTIAILSHLISLVHFESWSTSLTSRFQAASGELGRENGY